MNLSRVLSVAALILGIYILLSYLLSSTPIENPSLPLFKSREQFHIGCYLVDHNLTHHDNLVYRLEKLRGDAWRRQEKESRLVAGDWLDKKGVEVARNFQSFVNGYNSYKSRAQVNVELSRAVTIANLDFKRCIRDLNLADFSQTDCLQTWQLYTKCSNELNTLKTSLNFELTQKSSISEKAKNLLNTKTPSKLSSPGPHEDYLKQFRRRQKQLDDRQKIYEADLKLLSEKVSQAQFNYTIAKNNTAHAYYLYSQCSEHRIQFRLCQELNEEMLSLGHGSIENLDAKVVRKRTALIRIQKLFNDNQGQESSPQLKKLYYEYLEEYRKLLKLYVQTKAKIKKHCGCSEAEQLNLKLQVERSRREEQEREREVARYSEEHRLKLIGLNKVKDEKKVLLEDLEDKMKKLSKREQRPREDPLDILAQLQRERIKHQTQILALDPQFSTLSQKCLLLHSRLTSQITQISKIKDCRNKFQYYEELKHRLEREKPMEIRMDAALKRKLVESVEEFRI